MKEESGGREVPRDAQNNRAGRWTARLTRVWIKDEPWWGALGFKFEMGRVLGKC